MGVGARAAIAAASLVLAAAATAWSAESPPRPTIAADGTTHVPAFDLPPSSLASPESAAALRMRGAAPPPKGPPPATIEEVRAAIETRMAPLVAAARTRFPVDVAQQTIAGVPVRVITPKGRAPVPHRVLINLHGGAFMMCANACAFLESAPIAALGGFKVVTVDYREGPEAVFPAASEDVAAVYKDLLKTYKPSQVGIYGCSAGGILAAQVAAWLPAHGLPQAGAIGVFGAGARPAILGDSAYISAYTEPTAPRPAADGAPDQGLKFRSYGEGLDLKNPMAAPGLYPEVMAKFPPTLIITATRAPDLSLAIFTHSQLIKAGVPGDLIVGEGLGHCYINNSDLPEARDADQAIADFFRRNLK